MENNFSLFDFFLAIFTSIYVFYLNMYYYFLINVHYTALKNIFINNLVILL